MIVCFVVVLCCAGLLSRLYSHIGVVAWVVRSGDRKMHAYASRGRVGMSWIGGIAEKHGQVGGLFALGLVAPRDDVSVPR